MDVTAAKLPRWSVHHTVSGSAPRPNTDNPIQTVPTTTHAHALTAFKIRCTRAPCLAPSPLVTSPYSAANPPIVATVATQKPKKYPNTSGVSRSATAGKTPKIAPGPAAPWTTPTPTAQRDRQ
jgi:hypothetical protein